MSVDPTLDRRIPAPMGCVRVAVGFVLLLLAFVPIAFGASSLVQLAQPTPTPTPTAIGTNASIAVDFSELIVPTELPTETPTNTHTFTPDAWESTGTAFVRLTPTRTPTQTRTPTITPTLTASATLIYCWWLTPSPTPSPTWMYTPDSWGATGTAVYLATHPYQTPTAPPPRELCVELPTLIPSATLTPFPLPTIAQTMPTNTITPTATPTSTPVVITVVHTVVHTRVVIDSPPPMVITSPPQMIEQPPMVITSPPAVIIITAVMPTLEPTATLAEITDEPTPTPTFTETLTSTPTPTETPTPTPTLTETQVSA